MGHRLGLLLGVVLATGVFLVDIFLLPGSSVPAAFYAIPVVVAAFLLTPWAVLAVAALAAMLEGVGGIIDGIPVWRLAADILSLMIIGGIGTALAERIKVQTSLAVEKAALAEEIGTERARLAAVLTQMPSGVLVTEAATGRVVLGNAQMEQMWRPSTPGAADDGRPLEERYPLLHPDGTPYRPEEYPLTRALRRGERVRDEEYTYVRDDRSRGYLTVSAAPVRDAKGQIVAAVAIFQDITRRKEAELSREQYVHTISHDLRAPLTVVMGQAQLLRNRLQRRHGDADEVRGAEAIVTASQRMSVMIQELVDSARLESGQLRLELQPIDLKGYVNELLDRTRVLLDSTRLRVEIPDGLPRVMADADRLERILVNLISNALKYSPPDSSVLVAARREGERVVVSITDQGMGIPQEDLPHIFERFYRAAGRQQVEGLGLGLYITRMLVEAHGGRIWVESRAGSGSTFCFTLRTA